MKVRSIVLLLSMFLCSESFTMEHVKKDKLTNLNLSEIRIDKPNQENSTPPNTTRVLFEMLLERSMAKKNDVNIQPVMSPQQAVQQIGTQLEKRVEELKITDPELYQAIMLFKQKAEANARTPQEIEDFIRKNLDELPIKSKKVYEHLYHAHIDKTESGKKKDYELHEVLDANEPVDPTTLYHALLYRSASVRGNKNVVQKEVEKSKDCIDDWLQKMQELHPDAYFILMQAYEQAKKSNLNQQSAIPQLLQAVDQINNVEPLQGLMKTIQNELEVQQTADTVWSKAYKIMAALVGIGATVSASTGGILGGLFGASKAPVAVCTLAKCLLLMNVTIPG